MNSGASRPRSRHGCLIFLLLAALLAAGVVAVVRLWPQSMKERQDSAIEACEDKVNDQYPTNAEKKWRSADAVGLDKDHLNVTGRFFCTDIGNATFSCVVARGKVTQSFVSPG